MAARKRKRKAPRFIGATAYPGKGRVKPMANPKTVYDSAGKSFGKFKGKVAQIVARAIGGTVGKPKTGKSKNPFPVGRYVTVRAKRLPNGKVQLFGNVKRRKRK